MPKASTSKTDSLVLQASAGSDRAFGKLLEQCTVRLVLYIRRHSRGTIRSDADEEDLFQIVAARAWQGIVKFSSRGEGSFFRWLTVFADHEISNRMRYLKAKGRLKARQRARAPGEEDEEEPAGDITSPSSVAARREDIDRVQAALMALPQAQRDVVEACLLDEKSLSTIATSLGLAKSTVWERLSKGLAALKASLGRLHTSITGHA